MDLETERTHTLAEAEACIDSTLASLGLQVSLVRHGTDLSSTVATLSGHPAETGERVGCGKGNPVQARVGAKFVAYEHFKGVRALRAATQLADFHETLAQPPLTDVLPLRMLASQPARTIGVLQFNACAQQAALDYPVFLVDHTYASAPIDADDVDYHQARRYACGTGIAAGVGATEALLHAVSEVIERHAVGTWIAHTYYRGNPRHEAPIAPATLPPALTTLVQRAEQQLGSDIVLSHARSDIDCPVVVARCRDRRISGLHVAGSGASLYAEHAARRAIHELVQQYMVAEGQAEARAHWHRCQARLRDWPRLQPCLALPPGDGAAIPFAQLGGHPVTLPLEDHLQLLLQRCRTAGRPVWMRVLRQEAAGAVLACAVMPRMERFAVAALGGVVVPSYA